MLFRPGSRLMPCVLRYVTGAFRLGKLGQNLKQKLKKKSGTETGMLSFRPTYLSWQVEFASREADTSCFPGLDRFWRQDV